MQIHSVPFDRLTDQQLSAWHGLRALNPTLDSPFFHPEFTRAVSLVRDDVEVALVEDEGRIMAILPFHRQRGGIGRPVGLHLSDFQGLVAAIGSEFDAAQLIRGCGLSTLHFNHMLDSQQVFGPFHWRREPSPWMDVSGGFDHYLTTRANQQSDEIKQVARHVRKINRELGPVRIEPYCTDHAVLKTLINWKMAQYRKLKSVNHLAPAWVQSLLAALVDCRDEAFRGMLSVMHIGERVSAIHLGIRSHCVLHSWIPAYDPELAKYSPGAVLLIELARDAASLGIGRIDLGRGPEPYKQRFMSGVTMVNEGCVELRKISGAIQKSVRYTRELVRSSPMKRPAQYLVRKGREWLIALHWRRRKL